MNKTLSMLRCQSRLKKWKIYEVLKFLSTFFRIWKYKTIFARNYKIWNSKELEISSIKLPVWRSEWLLCSANNWHVFKLNIVWLLIWKPLCRGILSTEMYLIKCLEERFLSVYPKNISQSESTLAIMESYDTIGIRCHSVVKFEFQIPHNIVLNIS